MSEIIWRGLAIGIGSIALVTMAMVPWKLKARKKSVAELFRVFALSSLVRLFLLAAIAVWGFLHSPLSALVAILSFGTFFLIFTCFESYLLKVDPK